MPIPEYPAKKPPLLQDFDEWIYDKRPHGASVMEGSAIAMGIMLRMRQALTFHELHNMLHLMIVRVEERIQEGASLEHPDGGRVPFVTAEQWRDLDGGHEMIVAVNNPNIPDTIPDDWEEGCA